MPKTFALLRIRVILLIAFLSVWTGGRWAMAATETSVVISQVYGGGGNSGASYKNDFIELFNPTASAVTLTNYSIQYGSATSTTSLAVFLLPASVTIQPGQYYLIQGAAGAGGTVSLTPDAIITLNLSGTAGKVALVSSTTAVAGCPTADPTLVDFVGFGGTTTAVNCSLGSPAPLLSNTTSALRTSVCSPTSNNASDFSAGTPNPRSSTTPLAPCGGPVLSTPPTASGLATPAAVYSSVATLLTATVVPGTLPASTGIQVSANLSAIGGSVSQPFYDDGTHGDVAAGDKVFSYSTSTTALGSFTLPVSVSDSQLRTSTASIALTVAALPAFVPIRTIQATKPSTYATQTVTTSGIVVGVKSGGFYIDAPDADTTPTTPEGILVYTGSAILPSYIAVGANVQVTGVVNTYPTTGLTPGTEIDAPQTFSLISSTNPLPTPIKITAAMDSPTGGVKEFSKYEGMRVSIDSLTTTSGTGATLTEQTETNVSNGRFYGVVTGVARPFREPGIGITDTLFGAIPSGIPVWDSNPELLYIDSLAMGGTPIDLTSNATVTGIVGVMDFSFGGPEVLLDKATPPTVTGLMTATAVPARAATEFTAASFNMERFYNDVADADNPGSSVVVVTTAAYQRRLAKGSLAIRNVLQFPDLVGVQEIENLAVLTDLANKISTDAIAAGQPDPVYLPYLFLATDGTAINTGVLVKSTRVTTVRAEQFGLATTFTNSVGSQAVLNDRTPLVVHVGIKRASGPDYPVTFISVHQRSLINVDDPTSTGATVRLKREAQAEFLANLIQGYQAAGEHVITVGDYNGFEFSDGFVDVLGVTTGRPVAASQVVTPPAAGLASPALVDLVTLLPAAQRQSYVEVGSAQVLDHIVVTPDLVPLETRMVYAHIDSDFPLVYQNDATRPERVSDHDPAVAYFTVPPPPAPIVTLASTAVSFGSQLVGTPVTQGVTLTNTGNAALAITSITATGAGYTQTNNCSTSVAAGIFCTISVTFTPGTTGALAGSIAIVTNAASSPDTIGLAGTGIAPFVTLSATTVAFGTQLVTTLATKTVTLTNSGTATLAIASIAATGTGYSQTNNCGTSLAATLSCTLTVTFTPATTGALAGSISIVSNAAGSPATIGLTGTGGDFTLSPITPSVTIGDGATAILQVSATSVGGYAATLSLTCSGAIQGETCTVTPSVALTASGTQTIVATVTTTPPFVASAALPVRPGSRGTGTGGMSLAALLGFGCVGCIGMRRLRAWRGAISLCLALGALAVLAGCNGTVMTANANATPKGTQAVTLTATSGAVTRSTSVSLTVQ